LLLLRALKRGIELVPSSTDLEMVDGQSGIHYPERYGGPCKVESEAQNPIFKGL